MGRFNLRGDGAQRLAQSRTPAQSGSPTAPSGSQQRALFTIRERRQPAQGGRPAREVNVEVVQLPDRPARFGELRTLAAETLADPAGVNISYPVPIYNARGRITGFSGTLVIDGRITIETVYGPQARPGGRAAYGVGTRPEDEQAGTTTLRDHESGHLGDFRRYLRSHPIPAFTGRTGMTAQEWDDATRTFAEAIGQLVAAMQEESRDRTDEVGYTRSQFERNDPRPIPSTPAGSGPPAPPASPGRPRP